MKAIALSILALFTTACTHLGNDIIFEKEGTAIRGYDPVAYFQKDRAVEGSKEIQITHKGVIWQFSTIKNRDQFVGSPDKYTPQYGGYCAYAMSDGFVVSTDPEAFSIVNGKLYLNYSKSVRDNWLEKTEQFIEEADVHWEKKIAKIEAQKP